MYVSARKCDHPCLDIAASPFERAQDTHKLVVGPSMAVLPREDVYGTLYRARLPLSAIFICILC